MAATSFPRRVRTTRSLPKAALLITVDNCSLAFTVEIAIDHPLLYQTYISAYYCQGVFAKSPEAMYKKLVRPRTTVKAYKDSPGINAVFPELVML
jgi:hypothetical protein